MSLKKLIVLIAILIAATMLFTACAAEGPAGPAGEAAVMNAEDLTCTECHNDTSLITGKKAAWEESFIE